MTLSSEDLSLTLTREEASYLKDRVMQRVGNSLLAQVVTHCEPWERVEFPWQHPQLSSLPERLQRDIEAARCLSEIIVGASYLYNILLSEELGNEEWLESHRESFESWSETIEQRRGQLEAQDRGALWAIVLKQNPRIPLATRNFIDSWWTIVLEAESAPEIAQDRRARRLITRREYAVKRSRAKLQNRRQLELYSGSSGAYQLEFRWDITQTMALDILRPLAG